MKIKVLFFGSIKEIIGNSEIEIENVYTLNELIEKLIIQYPTLSSTKHLQWAVNEEYTTNFSKIINENDVIAIIPPVSGG